MAFCIKCGQELPHGAQFCANCGTPVTNSQHENRSERRREYAGKIIKCPACGEELSSFTAICPACGHEINSAKVSESLAHFISKIEECDRRIANSPETPRRGWATWKTGKRIGWILLNLFFAFIPMVIYFLRPLFRTDKAPSLTKEEKIKATTIENFAFPNDRASILEALLFIKSKVALLATEKVNANNAYWTRLWTKKAEGLHQKAEMMFPGDKIAANAYSEIIRNSEKVQKALKIRVILSVILLVAFVLFTGVRNGSFDDIKNANTPLEIPETELSSLMPQIEGGKGEVVTNNSEYFTVDYYAIKEPDFENYKKLCRDSGFTIDVQNDGSLFDAFNSDGYNIRITYYDSKMHITITDDMEMNTIIWPTSEIANLLPVPKSSYGNLYSSSDTCLIVYIGNTTIEDFNSYVYECMEKGFDKDVSRTDDHYHADNEDGYHVLVEYRGFDTIFIRIDD